MSETNVMLLCYRGTSPKAYNSSKARNTNRGGRLSTVDLLITVSCFVKNVFNIFNIKRCWSRLISTWRSSVFSLSLSLRLPCLRLLTLYVAWLSNFFCFCWRSFAIFAKALMRNFGAGVTRRPPSRWQTNWSTVNQLVLTSWHLLALSTSWQCRRDNINLSPVDELTVDEMVSTSWHQLALLTSWHSRQVGLSTRWWSTSHPRTEIFGKETHRFLQRFTPLSFEQIQAIYFEANTITLLQL
jgi:hypothetical protein